MSISIGSSLPDFELKDQDGNDFYSHALKGKQPVVIFFYPKNFTPNCTKEVCGFRDNFEDFTAANVAVVGISANSESSHKKFASRYKLPFTLLADAKKKVRRLFEVKNDALGLLPGRETFVFDNEGVLISKFKALNAKPHVDGALRMLKKLS